MKLTKGQISKLMNKKKQTLKKYKKGGKKSKKSQTMKRPIPRQSFTMILNTMSVQFKYIRHHCIYLMVQPSPLK